MAHGADRTHLLHSPAASLCGARLQVTAAKNQTNYMYVYIYKYGSQSLMQSTKWDNSLKSGENILFTLLSPNKYSVGIDAYTDHCGGICTNILRDLNFMLSMLLKKSRTVHPPTHQLRTKLHETREPCLLAQIESSARSYRVHQFVSNRLLTATIKEGTKQEVLSVTVPILVERPKMHTHRELTQTPMPTTREIVFEIVSYPLSSLSWHRLPSPQ